MSSGRRSSSRPSQGSSSAASRRCDDDEERRRSLAQPPDTSGSNGTRWARGGAHGFSWCDAAAGGLALGSAVAAMVVGTFFSKRKQGKANREREREGGTAGEGGLQASRGAGDGVRADGGSSGNPVDRGAGHARWTVDSKRA
jgi:hypothetical protein